MTRLPGLLALAFLALAACAPVLTLPGPDIGAPRLTEDAVTTADGVRLALRAWPGRAPLAGVIVALHGFNDYGNFIAEPAGYFNTKGYTVYAYDQRGFGLSPSRGKWAGSAAMARDLATVAGLVRARHPTLPLYLLGHSMGAAVIMVALAGADPPEFDGVILAGPAVWGRRTMAFYQRAALWIAAHTVPWMTLTGGGLEITPSDNRDMLIALGRDPLVIKATRIDAIYGLTNLMDRALAAAAEIDERALILIGERDEVIPARPTRRMLARLPASGRERRAIAYYPAGYHMLLRDLQRRTVWEDIVAWMEDPERALPSGAEREAARLLSGE